ncbi:MAG: hypothetical protein JHC24_02310 [Thaumarchaeota archaeon]|nr:hypothetical protein [Nitrososphaerota archaeon]
MVHLTGPSARSTIGPRGTVERMVQYLKEGAEEFDDPFPVGGRRLASGRAFERLRNWLPASTSMRDSAFEDGA